MAVTGPTWAYGSQGERRGKVGINQEAKKAQNRRNYLRRERNRDPKRITGLRKISETGGGGKKQEAKPRAAPKPELGRGSAYPTQNPTKKGDATEFPIAKEKENSENQCHHVSVCNVRKKKKRWGRQHESR